MRVGVWIRSVFRSLFRQAELDRDLDEELQSYLRMLTEEKVRAGMDPADAARQARLETHGVEQVRESVRDRRLGAGIDSIVQDVRFGLRGLARRPAFAIVCVIVLALGIGANATMFSIAHTLFGRSPSLVADPGSLVRFTLVSPDGRVSDFLPYPDYEYYRDQNRAFTGVLAYRYSQTDVAVAGADRPVQVTAGYVSDNYFDVLGVPLVHGRSFLPEENATPGTHPVVVVGEGFWRRHLGADPQAVGRTLSLNGTAYTVVGIAPAHFRGVSPTETPPDLFLPAMMRGFGLQRVNGQVSHSWNVIARLRRGADVALAQADMDVLQARYANEFASWIVSTGSAAPRVVLSRRFQFSPRVGDSLDRLLRVLFVVAGIVLVIACANVALLLLARASARTGEMAVRGALGASPWRIVRQLLIESLLLAVTGGALGLLIALWGAGLAASLIPYSFDVRFGFDASVALFVLALSVGATVLFGLLPALRLARGRALALLVRDPRRRTTARVRHTLVVAQLAMSVILVTGAGLFTRSLLSARDVDLGFDPTRKLLVSVPLTNAGYGREDGRRFVRNALDRLRGLPGVTGVSTTLIPPFGGRWAEEIRAPGSRYAEAGLDVGCNSVGADYFALMRIPLIAGRAFTEADDDGAPAVAVVNQTLAEAVWPGQPAIGKTLAWEGRRFTVIGVARDAHYYHLGESPTTQLYLSDGQYFEPLPTFVVNTDGKPDALARAVEERIRGEDPRILVHRVQTLAAVVAGESRRYQVLAVLVGMFGGLGLLLAAVGLYGVQAYLVGQRTREIGIRMAVGATRPQVARTVLGRGVWFACIGIGIGLAVAFTAARLVESLLFGVHARDPVTFVAAPLVLLAVAVVASLVPALRASAVDPVVALRQE
jgi:putative ABC transport system permease protein